MYKRTWARIVVWVIGVLLILLIAANFIVKAAVEKRLRASLQQFQPYIQAEFSKAHINLFAASVQLDSVYIQYDPELKHQHIHKLQFSCASIKGIHFLKLLMRKDLSAGSLTLKNADVQLDQDLLNHNDTLPDSFYKRIQLPFKNISFNNIEIKNAKISQRNNTKLSPICTGSILLSDVFIPAMDTAFAKDSIRFENIICDLKDINYRLQDDYSVQLKKFHINSRDSIMELDTLKLIPQVGKLEMGQRAGKQVDHINATVKNIKISGLDVLPLLQKKFIARQMSINKVNAYVFRDRRLPGSKEKQPMPLDYLKQIPYAINVQGFNLNDATVTSEEFPKEGDHTGYIKLENLYITMKPLINHVTKTNSSINSFVKASIMGAGDIQANINLSMINGSSHIKGAIDELRLTAMNPSAENLGKFHIESGVLNRLDFEFTATDTKASGQIVGVYHDLVIDRLKLTKDGLKKASMPSFLLHKIIIPKNKDASLDIKSRTGKIDFERDPTRLVTFYYLKALLDGIRDSFSLGFVLPS